MVTILGLLIAIAIGFAVSKDAKSRGMSQWWGVGVACLMIIFLPIYLIIRKPKQ